jgi:hypothetical protein
MTRAAPRGWDAELVVETRMATASLSRERKEQ